MAKLTARGRKRVSRKNFAGKGRSFPIHDKAHARKALQMAGKSKKASRSQIKKKVCRKYPGMSVCKGGK